MQIFHPYVSVPLELKQFPNETKKKKKKRRIKMMESYTKNKQRGCKAEPHVMSLCSIS